MYFYDLNPGPPWPEAILDPGTFYFNKLGKRLLGNATYQFQPSEPSSSEKEDFFLFFRYFYSVV